MNKHKEETQADRALRDKQGLAATMAFARAIARYDAAMRIAIPGCGDRMVAAMIRGLIESHFDYDPLEDA